MRAVVQRVDRASVEAEGGFRESIGKGVLVLLGVGRGDTDREALWLAGKIAELRIFEDAGGKMNLSLLETGGEALVVSQFTLYGDCRRGRRPGFDAAAEPEVARKLYRIFIEALSAKGIAASSGVFGATMKVDLVNDGPVTLILERGE
ncbi:MAG TPA: D-aminoacyl-tRNA deacylase [bacterium]|mgnify:CR=1 FL=1|nr:D-aminoacyl-tRNA deacylase [bacterium]HPJ71646.1 D-aminoacyl-tRNA deacylase [bacterium]HPQ65858.1 D-aminoacyl-tRNA deacylase [bacterium]